MTFRSSEVTQGHWQFHPSLGRLTVWSIFIRFYTTSSGKKLYSVRWFIVQGHSRSSGLAGGENSMILRLLVLSQYQHVTDGQTDRRTEGHAAHRRVVL